MTEVIAQPSIPALMRAARGSYAQAITRDLVAAGFEDVPRSGPFVLGGMVNWGTSVADMVDGLGVTRQAASQLIDILVLRGYLTRETNADDRRRITVGLTPRGEAAGRVVTVAIGSVDRELARRITARQIAGLRTGLQALADIKVDQSRKATHS